MVTQNVMKQSSRIVQLAIWCAALVVATTLSAQVRYRVSGGLSTMWITSDNPAVERIASMDTTKPFGGSLDGSQIGWGIRCYADLDKQKTLRIPFGIDLHMLSGTQSVTAPTYVAKAQHDVNIWTVHAGFEYAVVEFPLAFARGYVAGELRGAFVGQSNITKTLRTLDGQTGKIVTTVEEFSEKPSVFRLGAMARVGIEGELYYPLFLNTSVGYGILNLFLRDDQPTPVGRGELLTPTRISEPTEGMLQQLNFTFMLQVRL